MPVNPNDGPANDHADDEAFLSRWSRRKRTDPVGEEASPEPAAEPERELTDEELLAELDLPDPDTMKANDDFSAFMQDRVPERLRRRALRVLWRSNPVLANLDGMIDYGEDFTDSATVIENMQTVYEVGKGAAEKWKRHLAALAAAEDETEEDGEPAPDTPAEEAVAAAEPEPEVGIEPLADPVMVAAAPVPDGAPGDDMPAPRHMRFSFD